MRTHKETDADTGTGSRRRARLTVKPEDQSVADHALEVLDSCWTGTFTRPSIGQYPDQFSWDSAFVAIGLRHVRPDRAVVELERLFSAQWADGRVPHIVFGGASDQYFPGGGYWQARGAPEGFVTSGIVQPPVHATAVRRLHEASPGTADVAFLRRMFSRLVRWHAYLDRVRTGPDGLLEVLHPWETGLDNSPAADGVLAKVCVEDVAAVAALRRDRRLVDGDERPTDRDYGRYMVLVDLLRRVDYGDAPIDHPFRMNDVLFNSLYARACLDLAWIAKALGDDGEQYRLRGQDVAAAMDDHLWDEGRGIYLNRDAANDALQLVACVGGLMPMVAGYCGADRFERLANTLASRFLTRDCSGNLLVPTVAPDEATFSPVQYWRGPVWANTSWLIAAELRARGRIDLFEEVRDGLVNLVRVAGMREYFDPFTGEGRGATRFAWTAALTLDLLATAQPGN